jgi:hypothetical protein
VEQGIMELPPYVIMLYKYRYNPVSVCVWVYLQNHTSTHKSKRATSLYIHIFIIGKQKDVRNEDVMLKGFDFCLK